MLIALVLVFLIPPLATAASTTDTGWEIVHLKDVGFSISVPCDCPTEELRASAKLDTPASQLPANDAIRCYCASGLVPNRPPNLHGCTISVIYADYPETLLENYPAQDLLAAAIAGIRQRLEGLGYSVTERGATCGGYPGRETQSVKENSASWQRVCLVGDRMYKLGISGHKKDTGHVQRVFDSFALRRDGD
jgi:hypothetical protein